MLSSTLVVDPFQLCAVVARLCRRVGAAARCGIAFQDVQHFWYTPCTPAKPDGHRCNRWQAAKNVSQSRRRTVPLSGAPSIVREREQRHTECTAAADAVHLAAAARRRDGRARGARASISARLRRARPARRAPRPRTVPVAVAQPQPDPPRRAADDGLGRGRRARLRDGARVAAAPPAAPRAAGAEREASAHRGESSPGALPASHGIVGRRRSRPDPPRGPVRKSTSASGRSGVASTRSSSALVVRTGARRDTHPNV